MRTYLSRPCSRYSASMASRGDIPSRSRSPSANSIALGPGLNAGAWGSAAAANRGRSSSRAGLAVWPSSRSSTSRALFATHYHELARLEGRLAHVANLSLRAKEWNGDLVFLHEARPGPADRSYGVQVAKLAGDEALHARAGGQQHA